jgi:hypothetical protein
MMSNAVVGGLFNNKSFSPTMPTLQTMSVTKIKGEFPLMP